MIRDKKFYNPLFLTGCRKFFQLCSIFITFFKNSLNFVYKNHILLSPYTAHRSGGRVFYRPASVFLPILNSDEQLGEIPR
jgi:hypothetical protein